MLATKEVNTVPEAILVWPMVRYILGTGQYRCTILDLPLFLLFYTMYKVIMIFFDKHLVIMIILLVCLMFYIIL